MKYEVLSGIKAEVRSKNTCTSAATRVTSSRSVGCKVYDGWVPLFSTISLVRSDFFVDNVTTHCHVDISSSLESSLYC